MTATVVASRHAAVGRRAAAVRRARAGALAFVAAQGAVGACSLGFHAAMNRLLGAAAYGQLRVVLTLAAVLVVPVATVETLLAIRLVRRGTRPAVAAMVRPALGAGVAACVLVWAATPLLRALLPVVSVGAVACLGLYFLPVSVSVVPWTLLCGQRRFAAVGGIALVAAAVRIGFGILFVSRGYGVPGAMAASACADTVRAVLLTLAVRGRHAGQAGRAETGGVQYARMVRLCGAYAVVSAGAFAGMWLFTLGDSLMAGRLFGPVLAAQYNLAGTAVRVVFFISQALCLLAVPAFAHEQRPRALAALRATLCAAAVLGLLATLVFTVYGPRLMPALCGREVHVSGALVAVVGLAETALTLLWVVVQYQLARGAPAWMIWPGLLVAILGSLVASTPLTLAAVMAVAAAAAFALGAAVILRDGGRRAPVPAHDAGPLARIPADAVDLTVVVPFYNPGPALRANLLSLLSVLRSSAVSFEVIAVADGCTDGSADTIADLDPGTVRCIALPSNAGKGAALRLGLQEGRGRYLGFIDADGDLDPTLWTPFLTLMQLYEPDAVVGAKGHPLSEVDYGSGVRRAYSIGYRLLVRFLFPTLRVPETQVGIKLFRRRVLADVLPYTVERGFLFDLELLSVAHRLGHRRMLPAPVRLQRLGASTITAATVWRMLTGTVCLALRMRLARGYRVPYRQPAHPQDLAVLPLTRFGVREVW